MQKNKIFIRISAVITIILFIVLILDNFVLEQTKDINFGAMRHVSDGVVVIIPSETPLTNEGNQKLKGLQTEIIEKINDVRKEQGLGQLLNTKRLTDDASVRAQELEVKWSHIRPNGTQWYTVDEEAMYGENLGKGYTNADEIVDAWMTSPTHRDNILFDKFKTIGVSVYVDSNNNYWIAQEFGY